MSDYDIVIKLDPGQPVAGAQKVTDAVAKVETQSEKAQDAVSGLSDKLKKQVESTSELSKKWSELSKAMLGQALNDSFRKISEGAKEATGGVLDLNMAFAGYQAFGPWGAAIGAVGGALSKLSIGFGALDDDIEYLETHMDEIKKKGEDHARNWLPELTDAVYAHADAVQDQYQRLLLLPVALGAVTQAFASQRDILKQVNAQIAAYDAARFAASPQGNLVKGFTEGVNGKDYRKPGGERTYNNGPSLLDFQGGQNRTPYMGLGESAGADGFEQYDLAKLAQDNLNDKIKANADETLKLAESTRKWNDELEATTGYTAIIENQLKSAATSFADQLVEAANGADVSWSNFFETLLKNMEKAIAQALILQALTGSVTGSGGGIGGGAGGLLGLLGFASGGVIGPSGSGTTDTQTVMFRKSPSETVRINTPQQEAAYRGGGGSQAPIHLTVAPQIHDERAIQAAMAGPGGQRVIYNVVRQAMGAVRPLG